ncbi:MAG: 16S rRNA (guanine(527)-N(7))-methyltransferase RsmG [Candidatus Korobacteraceae bacterium]
MEGMRIAQLLQPFTDDAELPPPLLEQLQVYLDLLLRWNARINLTAVRHPEQVVTRHFGESLFAAGVLFGDRTANSGSLADVGSGAGFPGIPIKLFEPELELVLIESQSKKATFLREVLRALHLDGAEVFGGRAEEWGKTADLVTLRAVEQFERALPVAAKLVAPGGRLCLLIGSGQVSAAQGIIGDSWMCREAVAVPQSTGRVVLIAERR